MVSLLPMTEAHLDSIEELEAQIFGIGKWSRGMFQSELEAPARHYRVAHAEAVGVVGYAGVFLGESSQVMTIGVAPQWQRRGIGASLLADLIQAAREWGAKEMLLEVRVDAHPPQAMYKSFGFRRVGIRKNYYQAEGVDALVMHKQLRKGPGPIGSEVTA